jgi:hypothetical protein
VEREGAAPGDGDDEPEELAAPEAVPPDPGPRREEREFYQDLEEADEEPEPSRAEPQPAMPRPSILFTTPAKPSSWLRITTLILGIIGGLVVGGLAMWFWGGAWISHHFKFKGKPPAAATKMAGKARVETVSPPLTPPAGADSFKGLELFNQEERYRGLVNKKGGQLLLIQGKIKNASTHPWGPIQMQAVLTDLKHKVVSQRKFYAGTVIFDDELQNLDPEEINRWLNTPGGRAQKQILEPGETQSYMVVFFGAPKSLTGYGYRIQIIKGAEAPSQSRRK